MSGEVVALEAEVREYKSQVQLETTLLLPNN